MSFGKKLRSAIKNKWNPKYSLTLTRHLRHKYGLTRSKLLPSSSYQGANATGSDIYGPTGSIASKFAVNH